MTPQSQFSHIQPTIRSFRRIYNRKPTALVLKTLLICQRFPCITYLDLATVLQVTPITVYRRVQGAQAQGWLKENRKGFRVYIPDNIDLTEINAEVDRLLTAFGERDLGPKGKVSHR